ncbi:MAG: EAL domain-containing protein [Gammaproteobacteria bacterium]|nr:EAL domain-containing protein [Gammaproteobacteria bacterium]
MTLFKQIAILVSAVFLILLLIILYTDLTRTGNFQQGQLQTTAQDMATTLGIAISNLPEGQDQSTLEVLFNAVFDSGYYTRIELIGVDGQSIHQKSRQLEIAGVPDWFLGLVPLEPARGTTQVMKGWTQLGQLNLEIHPGFAYSGMYQALVSTLLWLALLFVVSMLVLWLILRYLLDPLQRVKEQADAIHSNKFVHQRRIPSTIELKRVVEAMNLMVSKVQTIFDDQEKTLGKYQQLLYRDKLTNLGNRRYLLDQLQQSMSEESGSHGCMAIIKIVGFDQLRDRLGYEISDNLIRILADLLRQTGTDQEAQRISRFNEDEFAFLSTADESAVTQFLGNLFDDFQKLTNKQTDFAEVKLLAGICDLQVGGEIGGILSSIDYCLSQADTKGPFSIERKLSTNLDLPQGKMQWRSWLESMLKSNQLFLVGQLAIGNERFPVQRELFIRARNKQDQIIPASAFMPMASSLGMSLDIDIQVFQMVTSNSDIDRKIPLAINLSAAFFEHAEAQQEFDQLLSSCEQSRTRLCIEASHHVLNQHPIMCAEVSERVRKHQHQFGIDNLDLGQSLQLLQSGQFNYAKINAKTLHQMSRNDMPSGYQALRTITDTLDIQIIAVGVDSQEVFDELKSIGIDIMQGNFLSPTEAI